MRKLCMDCLKLGKGQKHADDQEMHWLSFQFENGWYFWWGFSCGICIIIQQPFSSSWRGNDDPASHFGPSPKLREINSLWSVNGSYTKSSFLSNQRYCLLDQLHFYKARVFIIYGNWLLTAPIYGYQYCIDLIRTNLTQNKSSKLRPITLAK